MTTKLESKPRRLYDGTSSRKKLTQFQEAWRKCLQLSTWKDKKDQVKKFGGFLSGDALTWWNGLSSSERAAIKDGRGCLVALRKEFDLSNERNIYTTLLRKKRHKHEDSLSFVRRILRVNTNMQLSGSQPMTPTEENDVAEHVVRRFPKSVSSRSVLLMAFRSPSCEAKLKDIKDFLVEEAKQENTSSSSSSSDSWSEDSDSIDSVDSENEEYKRRKSSKSKAKRNKKSTSNSKAIVLALQELRADLKERKDITTPTTTVTEKFCIGCKGKGHTIDRCYKFGPVWDKCRFRGHPTETCRAPACPRCPGKYHFFRLCPVLKNEEKAELLKSQKN